VLLGLGTVVFERLRPSFWLRSGHSAYIGQVMKSIRDMAKGIPATDERERTVDPMSRLLALFGSSFR
jgi:hypothetical protein